MFERFGALRCLVIVCGWALCAAARAQQSAEEVSAEAHEHADARLALGADLVLGFDTLPRRGLSLTGAGRTLTSQLYEPGVGVTESLLASGSYELLPRLRVGARLAVSLANHVTAGDERYRPIAAISNVELEGEYELPLGEHTELAVVLGVALPTASGREIEAEDYFELMEGRAATGALQGLVQRAAAAARGFEENALFEAERVGLIPKVSLLHQAGALRLEAYLKLENLISTRTRVEERYLGELIGAGFAGYEVARPVVLGLRAWANLDLAELDRSALMVEPQMRMQLGLLHATLGLIVPLASPLAEPVIAGLRLAAAARF